jgi:hypothetical protein
MCYVVLDICIYKSSCHNSIHVINVIHLNLPFAHAKLFKEVVSDTLYKILPVPVTYESKRKNKLWVNKFTVPK